MSKRNKISIGLIVFLFVLVGIVIHDGNMSKKSSGRVRLTFVTLQELRIEISNYKNINGNYPESLLSLKNYMADSQIDTFLLGFSYINFEKVTDFSAHEIHNLDGSGGLYYNNETGEIRVNLDRPVKFHEPDSPLRRDEIPAEW